MLCPPAHPAGVGWSRAVAASLGDAHCSVPATFSSAEALSPQGHWHLGSPVLQSSFPAGGPCCSEPGSGLSTGARGMGQTSARSG